MSSSRTIDEALHLDTTNKGKVCQCCRQAIRRGDEENYWWTNRADIFYRRKDENCEPWRVEDKKNG